MIAPLLAAGCGGGGFSLAKAEVDRSLTTSNVPQTAQRQSDSSRISDEVTIRNAVSSADLDSLGGQPLSWANADTGARGVIQGLSEQRVTNLVCRRFTATRESFDGVRLYKGEACMSAPGAWRLQEFSQV